MFINLTKNCRIPLFIDTRDTFNEENRTVIVWMARNEYPSGVHFSCNMYIHHSNLAMRRLRKRKDIILFKSKEGATQDYPLVMVVCLLLVFHLSRMLKKEFNEVKSRGTSQFGYFWKKAKGFWWSGKMMRRKRRF